MTIFDVVQIINAMAAAFVLGLVILRGRRWYHVYTVREKVFHNGMIMYALSACVISLEGFFIDSNHAIGPFIILIANIYALVALIKYKAVVFVNVEHPGI